ncbi:MAG: polysaccharide deacetylase family protein [Spirulina sp. SIO3F2]|nr:polysaccharide deacetylase family protein [Spirulina sp. SIO3F2]
MLTASLVRKIARFFPSAVFYKDTPLRKIAITIDDVGGRDSWEILTVLTEFNQTISSPDKTAHVTFFVITNSLPTAPGLLTELIRQGHEIGNHGCKDHRHANLSSVAFRNEIQQAHQILTTTVDAPIQWFRPGQVLYNRAMLQTLKALPGYHPQFALGSAFPLDTRWPTCKPGFTLPYLSQFIFPGAILVLHGGTAQRSASTAQVLRQLLPRLHQQGYQMVTLSKLWAGGS